MHTRIHGPHCHRLRNYGFAPSALTLRQSSTGRQSSFCKRPVTCRAIFRDTSVTIYRTCGALHLWEPHSLLVFFLPLLGCVLGRFWSGFQVVSVSTTRRHLFSQEAFQRACRDHHRWVSRRHSGHTCARAPATVRGGLYGVRRTSAASQSHI